MPQRPKDADETAFRSHLARHGFIHDPTTGSVIDEVVLIPYEGPHSYTGENLVEINCHGSPLIAGEILHLCLTGGARLAGKGEFTRRAFLNGRMDLTQAEAVLDLMQAKTGRQSHLAVSALSGQLGLRIKDIRNQLVELTAKIGRH